MNYKKIPNSIRPKLIRPQDKNLPILNLEKKLTLRANINDEANKILYDTFYNALELYINKVPNSSAKAAVQKLCDRKLIFIGRSISPGKNGLLGIWTGNNDKLAGVILDIIELEISPINGETDNIDSCFYAIYFNFIRAAVSLNMRDIRNDKKLHDLINKYIYYLCLRLIGMNVNLNNKQKDFLKILSSYFFFRFLLNLVPKLAQENAFKGIDKEVIKEVTPLMSRLDKYDSMKDIFKALIDFGFTTESPTSLMVKALSKLKLTAFYSFTSTLDYVIALAIVSKYPMPVLSNAMISNDLQTQIEKIIFKYISRVQFDTKAFSHI